MLGQVDTFTEALDAVAFSIEEFRILVLKLIQGLVLIVGPLWVASVAGKYLLEIYMSNLCSFFDAMRNETSFSSEANNLISFDCSLHTHTTGRGFAGRYQFFHQEFDLPDVTPTFNC